MMKSTISPRRGNADRTAGWRASGFVSVPVSPASRALVKAISALSRQEVHNMPTPVASQASSRLISGRAATKLQKSPRPVRMQ